MSMSINIDSFLNSFVQNQTAKLNKNNNTPKNSSGTAINKSGVDDSIFAVASAVVSDYKSKQDDQKSNSTTSGKSFLELANMSTEEFKNYASSNEARSAYDSQQKSDTTGIKLPMLVRYKAEVFSTSGKSFMQVVAKIKGKYPQKSEEDIAATLMSKYATEEQIANIGEQYSINYTTTQTATKKAGTTGNRISFNA